MTAPADTLDPTAARAELDQIIVDLNSRPELVNPQDALEVIALVQRGREILAALSRPAEETP